MHPDRAVGAVIDHHDDHVRAILRGGGEFLAVHHEIAVSRDSDHGAFGEAQSGSDGGRHAVTHRAAGRGELAGIGGIAPVAVPPPGKIARTVADDRIRRKRGAHGCDAGGQINGRIGRLRRRPVEPFRVSLGPGIERDHRCIFPQRRTLGEFIHRTAQREIGAIDPAQLLRVGVDVDQQLAGMLERRDLVTIGRRLPQPRADGDDEVGVFDPLHQLGARAVAQVPGIDRAVRRNRVLTPEGRRHGKPDAFSELLEVHPRLGVPARAADDRDRARRVRDQIEQRLHRIGAGSLRGAGDEGAGLEAGGHMLHQHILGQGEHHRAGPSIDRDRIGAGDIFGDARRIIDPRRPFADRRKEGGEIDLLKALAPLHSARDIAHEQDHRLRILMRDMDADAGIGRARTASDERNAGAT